MKVSRPNHRQPADYWRPMQATVSAGSDDDDVDSVFAGLSADAEPIAGSDVVPTDETVDFVCAMDWVRLEWILFEQGHLSIARIGYRVVLKSCFSSCGIVADLSWHLTSGSTDELKHLEKSVGLC